MRTFATVVVAGLLGLSSAAFAAAPVETTTREARMEAALKDYRANKAAAPSQPVAKGAAKAAPAAKKHHVAKKHRAVRHAKAGGTTAVKVAPAPAK